MENKIINPPLPSLFNSWHEFVFIKNKINIWDFEKENELIFYSRDSSLYGKERYYFTQEYLRKKVFTEEIIISIEDLKTIVSEEILQKIIKLSNKNESL